MYRHSCNPKCISVSIVNIVYLYYIVFYTLKPIFHLANLFARTDKKVGTLLTCSQRIFSPANFDQSRCRILVFASRRANKVAKWKIGFTSCKYCTQGLRTNYYKRANDVTNLSESLQCELIVAAMFFCMKNINGSSYKFMYGAINQHVSPNMLVCTHETVSVYFYLVR